MESQMALGTHSGSYHYGDHAAVCDICGIRFRRSQLRYNWKRQLVCGEDFDPRNPQDYAVTPRQDRQAVVNPRPEPTCVYVDSSLAPDYDSLPAQTGTGSNHVYSS